MTVTIRDRFDAARRRGGVGRLRRRRPARHRDDPRPSAAGEAIGVAVAATVDLAPGERRSIRFALAWDLPVVEFGAGRRWYKRYTRDWGRTGERAFDLASHALEQAPAWRAAIEAWQRPVLDVGRPPRLVQGGPLQRALLPRRWRHVLGGRRGRTGREPGPRRPRPVRAARVPRLPVLRQRRCRLLCLVRDPAALPGARGARDPRPAGRGGRRRPGDRHDRARPGCRPRARSAGRSRTTWAARTTTRSTARTAIDTRTSTTGRTSVPSSSSRCGATRWPPGPRAMPSSAMPGRRSRRC